MKQDFKAIITRSQALLGGHAQKYGYFAIQKRTTSTFVDRRLCAKLANNTTEIASVCHFSFHFDAQVILSKGDLCYGNATR